MKFKIFFLMFSIFFITCSNINAIDFKEGNWAIKMQIEMEGMPMQMPPVTMDQCMTKDDMILKQSKDESECKVVKQIKGSTVTWVADCPEGKSTGSITYTERTLKGKINIEVKGERTMKMSYTLDGNYKGLCNK